MACNVVKSGEKPRSFHIDDIDAEKMKQILQLIFSRNQAVAWHLSMTCHTHIQSSATPL